MTKEITKLAYKDLKVVKPVVTGFDEILTEDALEFLSELVHNFSGQIEILLNEREQVQEKINQGFRPTFPEETAEIRVSNWNAAELPEDLNDRRVEITGPVDRKMIINALNSNAQVFMADFEDSNSPTWFNIIQGQINLRDAVNGDIEYTKPDGSKRYSLEEDPAVLMVRPRGLHLKEAGIQYQGAAIPGAIVDFGLYFYHNAIKLLDNGTGPYFYLPKLQHYKEARLWNDIFIFAQNYLNIPQGTIKATVLLEHILAAFQMDEILYELREHSAGLNSGRWDYIFSFIKTFSKDPDFVLPNRDQITMDRHFLQSYVTHLVQTCHRRGVHGMGGMAAQIPIRNDPERNRVALEKVRLDKIREAKAGHDGTWVAHPGLIQIAKDAFDEVMTTPNQINFIPENSITAEDLLKVPEGTITEDGVRLNINVGIRYLASWLRGNGCVPIYNLMEDAATAEISRSQLWQWVYHGAELDDGRTLTEQLFLELLNTEVDKIRQEISEDAYEQGQFNLAKSIFKELTLRDELPEFLTLEAYDHLKTEDQE